MKSRLQDLRHDIQQLASPEKARNSARFFKSGPGHYGEGDMFMGLTVPQQRVVAKKYAALSFQDIETLLRSKWHEERLTTLLIMVSQYKKATPPQQKMLYELYMCHVGPQACKLATGHKAAVSKRTDEVQYGINNWDLVDSSAGYIVGPWLGEKASQERLDILGALAKGTVWERRVAMLSCFHYIKQGKSSDAFVIADVLLQDDHDLMHKAVGWMLREIGKRCGSEKLVKFLQPRYKTMPRTMLRYAIEHFPPEVRRQYLKGEV